MKGWLPLAGIGLLAGLAGVSLMLAGRHAQTPAIEAGPIDASPAAIHAAQFRDGEGATRSLGQFAGKVVVVNFWATWCTPCREEMPGFVKLQSRWQGRGVQFVGIAHDEADKVAPSVASWGSTIPSGWATPG